MVRAAVQNLRRSHLAEMLAHRVLSLVRAGLERAQIKLFLLVFALGVVYRRSALLVMPVLLEQALVDVRAATLAPFRHCAIDALMWLLHLVWEHSWRVLTADHGRRKLEGNRRVSSRLLQVFPLRLGGRATHAGPVHGGVVDSLARKEVDVLILALICDRLLLLIHAEFVQSAQLADVALVYDRVLLKLLGKFLADHVHL